MVFTFDCQLDTRDGDKCIKGQNIADEYRELLAGGGGQKPFVWSRMISRPSQPPKGLARCQHKTRAESVGAPKYAQCNKWQAEFAADSTDRT